MAQTDSEVAALAAAVGAGNASQARRILSCAGEATSQDTLTSQDKVTGQEMVEVLAQHAATGSVLGVELLVETVDRFGLARNAVRRYLLDEAAVDDVTQDTLITVARAVGTFRGEAKFTTWLHQLARNRAVDHLRRTRATQTLGDEEGEPTPTARMSSLVASRQAVRALLEELPGHYRDAVMLRDVEQLPYGEIADRLGRNLNTVKSHVARGRALLAGLVERSSAG